MRHFRERLRAGERVLGTMLTLPCPAVAEAVSHLGFDWFFVDGEHGPLETGDVQAILQAVAGRAACLVRVPAGEEHLIKRTLDLGADGVIVPQVNTAEQAANVVRWSRYAPQGSRGVGIARAHGYGRNFKEYVETANDTVTVVVQAEHATAVENIEAIARVPGIDCVLIGPYDLAASLGHMGDVSHPDVVAAIDHVTTTCQAAGIPLGTFGVKVADVQPYVDKGYGLIVVGVDVMLLAGAAKRVLDDLRAEGRG